MQWTLNNVTRIAETMRLYISHCVAVICGWKDANCKMHA